jgi:hypothetical protein
VTTTVTTTVWVVYCVHNDTTDAWTLAKMAIATSFSDFDVLVLLVAEYTDSSSTS